jgi:hypothetical protein
MLHPCRQLAASSPNAQLKVVGNYPYGWRGVVFKVSLLHLLITSALGCCQQMPAHHSLNG